MAPYQQKSNEYINSVLTALRKNNPHEPEYVQAAEEILLSLRPVVDRHPEYRQAGLLERFVEPERMIGFAVPWVDDSGIVHVEKGYRVQFNGAIGPYKGGLRFHPSVNWSVMKFLGLEQTLKNSLTGLPIGGAKGGSTFDPKGKSDGEVRRFCQSMMTELYRHIGQDMDVPAGDIGVGEREIGYLFGQYRRIKGGYIGGVLTGKGLSYGGSKGRTQATGYGLLYFVRCMLESRGLSVDGMRTVISGSGNVAIYACEMAQSMGAKVVAMSDSNGYVYDEKGIDLAVMKQIKLQERGRVRAYADRVNGAVYHENWRDIWSVPCDLALPCATQNDIDEQLAQGLIANGVKAVGEGANMPVTLTATRLLQDKGVLVAPAKAANAGGVAVSALEMSQNSMRLAWSEQEVLDKLQSIMRHIHELCYQASEEYGMGYDLVAGANIAGFDKVAKAMLAQGIL